MQFENLIFKPAMFKLVVPFTEKYKYKYNYTAISGQSKLLVPSIAKWTKIARYENTNEMSCQVVLKEVLGSAIGCKIMQRTRVHSNCTHL